MENHNQPFSDPSPLSEQLPSPKRRGLLVPVLVAGVLFCLLLFLAGFIFLLFALKGAGPVKVTRNSVLELNISGLIEEYRPASPFETILNYRAYQFHDYLQLVRKAEADAKIEGILLRVEPSSLSWAQMEELRHVLDRFKQSGKWIVATGSFWQDRDYFLASVADKVCVVPGALLFIDGLSASRIYYADLLKKYGVGVQVQAFGKYKSFADSYRRNDMSEPDREATQSLLDGIEAVFLQGVSSARNLTAEQITKAVNEGVYEADQALEAGLVDAVAYEDELKDIITQLLGGVEPRAYIQGTDYGGAKRADRGIPRNAIAVIYASGSIVMDTGGQSPFGNRVISPSQFIGDLDRARRSSDVRAIVLRIDTGGGSSLASDLIWREIHRTAEMGKPVIASMSSLAASGGYYMAMACDEIYAQPTTITGSIGTVSMRLNLENLLENLHLHSDGVKTAPHADFLGLSRALSPEEEADLRRRTKALYDDFVAKAARDRNLAVEDMEPYAQGRPWTGFDAQRHGLVDHLGSLSDAVAAAAEKAGLSDYNVVRFPREESYLDLMRKGTLALERKPSFSWLAEVVPQELQFLVEVTSGFSGKMGHLAISPFGIRID